MFHRCPMFVCVIDFASVPVRPDPFPAHPRASAPASVRRHLGGPSKSSYNKVVVKVLYRLSLNQPGDQDAARTGTTGTVSQVRSFEELKLVAWRSLTPLREWVGSPGVSISLVLLDSPHKALPSEDRSQIDLRRDYPGSSIAHLSPGGTYLSLPGHF